MRQGEGGREREREGGERERRARERKCSISNAFICFTFAFGATCFLRTIKGLVSYGYEVMYAMA